MSSYCHFMLALCACALLCACTTTTATTKTVANLPATLPVEWTYAKEAISLHLTSDPQLNLFQKRPHALVVCMYHLREPNGFNLLVEEQEGLHKLLDCGRFDTSVTYAKKLVVQPGREVTELLDRAEGTKYVGLVAGYYNLRKETSVRLLPVPVVDDGGWFSTNVRLDNLLIDLHLGPQEIQDKKAATP